MGFITKLFGRSSPSVAEKGLSAAQWDRINGPDAPGGISVAARRAAVDSLGEKEAFQVSIAVNKAVSVIANNLAKAERRIFTPDGDEVIGGPLVDLFRNPAPFLSGKRLVREIVQWLCIAGEFALWAEPGVTSPIAGLYPLDPFRLRAGDGSVKPRHRGDVPYWLYRWADASEQRMPNALVVHERLFNPMDPVRGQSPLLAGTMTISAGHYALKFNKDYFGNGGAPSIIASLPAGTSRAAREDFMRQWNEEFSYVGDGGHKFLAVVGSEVKVQHLEGGLTRGSFMDLLARTDEQVAMLYGVPFLEMGLSKESRFDTVDAERELFSESTLEPLAELISGAIQNQLVDPFFKRVRHQVRRRPPMGKALEKAVQRAAEDNPGSGVLFLIDTDTLPIAAKVKLAKVKTAKALREDLFFTPQGAAEFVGIDIDDADERNRKMRSHIWVTKNLINITDPAESPQLMASGNSPESGDARPGKPGADAKPAAAAKKPKPKKQAPSPEALRQARRFLRDLRRLALDAADRGEPFALADADALSQSPAARKLARLARHQVRVILASLTDPAEGPARPIKDYFNTLATRRTLLSLL